MMQIDISNLSPATRQQWLQHAIAPRPICFAATMNGAGQVNLSPFSFFNLFSSHPPIVVFSPARRVRDNTTKHTLENVRDVPELTINIVDYNMVHQVSLSSCEYPAGVNEFIKAGFSELPSERVKPPRVAESKVQMECRVIEVKALGNEGGAGNLVICEVLLLHVDESILNEERTMIDQQKLHLVARLGGDWYCRVDPSNLFHVEKPNQRLGMGFDRLPDTIRRSRILTGNQLAALANLQTVPEIDPAYHDPHLKQIIQYFSPQPDEFEFELHRHAAYLIERGQVEAAWQVLLTTAIAL